MKKFLLSIDSKDFFSVGNIVQRRDKTLAQLTLSKKDRKLLA